MSNKITRTDKNEILNKISKINTLSSGICFISKIDSNFFEKNFIKLYYNDIYGNLKDVKLSKNSLMSYLDNIIEVLYIIRKLNGDYSNINVVLMMMIHCSNFGPMKAKFVKSLLGSCSKEDSEIIDILYTIIIPGVKIKNGKTHNGHTVYRLNELKQTISEKTQLKNIENLLIKYYESKIIGLHDNYLGYSEHIEIEKYIYELTKQKSELKLPKITNVRFNESQRKAIEILTESNDKVNLLLGLAGTGKSFVVASIIESALLEGINVAVACPTNAAVQVISKSLEDSGIDTNALVFNRILTIDAAKYDRKNTKKVDLFILDESSMSSTLHFDILRILNPEKIILVGDPEQLPPIEAGCPFSDLTQSDVTKAFLTQQMRSKSTEIKEIIKEIDDDKLNFTKIFPFSQNKQYPLEINQHTFDKFKKYLIEHKDDVFIAEQNNLVDALNIVLLDIKYNNESLDENIVNLIKAYFSKQESEPIDFTKYVGETFIWDGMKFECPLSQNYSIVRGSIGKILKDNKVEINCIKTKDVNDKAFRSFIFDYVYIANNITKTDRPRLIFARTVHKSQGSSFDKVTYLVKDSSYITQNQKLTIKLNKDMAYVACSRAINNLNVICLIHDISTTITPKTNRDTLLSILI